VAGDENRGDEVRGGSLAAGQPGRRAFVVDLGGRADRVDDVEDRAVYVISVAAELAGVHPQTLRIYERKGLLFPKRTAGKARRYSARDIQRLRMIQDLTQRSGVNLAGVKLIMQMQDELERLQRRAARLEQELQRRSSERGGERGRADILPMRSSRVIFPWAPPATI
jgi:MerR family transcriptional regulator, heat shock protein HspR